MWRVRAKGIWETPLGCVGLAALTVGIPAGIMIAVVCAETTPKEADQTLTSHSSLIGLCELPPRYFTESAPRTETGPAPIWLYHQQNGGNPGRARIVLDALPDSPHLTWREHDVRRVQLVGCTGIDKDDHRDSGKRCTYADRTVPLRTGRYLLELREAATGRLTARGRVEPANPQCPSAEDFKAYGETLSKAFATPTAEEYATAFEELAREKR